MRTKAINAGGCEGNAVRLCLPATVDNFCLASLLNPLLERQQYRICLDVSRVLRLGTVEFRLLEIFAESCARNGGFLRLEHVGATLAALLREFGLTNLMPMAPEKTSARPLSQKH